MRINRLTYEHICSLPGLPHCWLFSGVAKFGSSPYVETITADPIRIMEAIITGISFLGAGTIIFKSQQETIEGLTTAASILFAAAIGIAVALNAVGMVAALTGLVIVILFGLGFLERKIRRLRNYFRKSEQ
ncbi:MAG: MgtC/SapB family protein [Balneolaceae bacterium]|nr:MgtC/SapB family protein [Balneolaceae bacterium]